MRFGADFGAPCVGELQCSLFIAGADDGSPVVGFTARAEGVAAILLAAVDGSFPDVDVAGHQSA